MDGQIKITENNTLESGTLYFKMGVTAPKEKIIALIRYLIANDFMTRDEVEEAFGEWNIMQQVNSILGKEGE